LVQSAAVAARDAIAVLAAEELPGAAAAQAGSSAWDETAAAGIADGSQADSLAQAAIAVVDIAYVNRADSLAQAAIAAVDFAYVSQAHSSAQDDFETGPAAWDDCPADRHCRSHC
jgi:hypothetical protein